MACDRALQCAQNTQPAKTLTRDLEDARSDELSFTLLSIWTGLCLEKSKGSLQPPLPVSSC